MKGKYGFKVNTGIYGFVRCGTARRKWRVGFAVGRNSW